MKHRRRKQHADHDSQAYATIHRPPGIPAGSYPLALVTVWVTPEDGLAAHTAMTDTVTDGPLSTPTVQEAVYLAMGEVLQTVANRLLAGDNPGPSAADVTVAEVDR